MQKVSPLPASRFFAAALCACLAVGISFAQVSVRSVKVLGTKDSVEVEVETSDRIIPQTQVLTGPDRLVVDFPNAVPGNQLHSQSVDRGEVKDVRVSLFQNKPPVTRVVLDLKAARSYQIFPSGRTVMIKVTGGSTESANNPIRPGLVSANYKAGGEPIAVVNTTRPSLEVSYRDGLLAINANKATLAQVLYAVQQRTGADISVPSGAEQERVVAFIEPASAPEVLARLLNGSRFNFLILSATNDPSQLERVILTPRSDGGFVPPPAYQSQSAVATMDDNDDEQAALVPNSPSTVAAAPAQPATLADAQGKLPEEGMPEQ